MTVSKGNAGEHLVMAELLYRGFDAYWADRGNPAYDIACFWNAANVATRLRVKTTSDGGAVWSAKKTGAIFLERQAVGDYVIICDLRNGVRGSEIYVVPTGVVERHLIDTHAHWAAHPGKKGQARSAAASFRVLRFFGAPQTDNLAYGYHDTFADYRDAWHLLQTSQTETSAGTLAQSL